MLLHTGRELKRVRLPLGTGQTCVFFLVSQKQAHLVILRRKTGTLEIQGKNTRDEPSEWPKKHACLFRAAE